MAVNVSLWEAFELKEGDEDVREESRQERCTSGGFAVKYLIISTVVVAFDVADSRSSESDGAKCHEDIFLLSRNVRHI